MMSSSEVISLEKSQKHAGVLIIGGGLIGSSIAWRLAQKGARVTVVDAGNLGGEASTAGAGMLAPGSEAAKPSRWLDLGIESLRLYPAFIDELRAETGLDVEFRACGCLVMDPGDNLQALHRASGVRVERRTEGLFYPDDALTDPSALLRSLRQAGKKHGVKLEHGGLAEAEAAEHRAVVIAAGAWSGGLRITYNGTPVLLPESKPVKGHLIGFQMRKGLLGPFLRKGHTYVLQRGDGLVIAGTTEENVGFDTSVEFAACDGIHRRAADIVPELAAVEPVRRWIGFRPGPELEDGPILRRVEGTNVWLAYGHYRNGILLTPVTAQTITEQVLA
jgi:glycine oxidase